MANNKGYHASGEAKDKKCASCHGEHFGRDFIINKFDTTLFNHQLAGFELLEKHKQISCNKCHTEPFIKNKSSQKKRCYLFGTGNHMPLLS